MKNENIKQQAFKETRISFYISILCPKFLLQPRFDK